MRALSQKWLPRGDADDPEAWGAAWWLEERFWEQMEIAVANGIARAFGK